MAFVRLGPPGADNERVDMFCTVPTGGQTKPDCKPQKQPGTNRKRQLENSLRQHEAQSAGDSSTPDNETIDLTAALQADVDIQTQHHALATNRAQIQDLKDLIELADPDDKPKYRKMLMDKLTAGLPGR